MWTALFSIKCYVFLIYVYICILYYGYSRWKLIIIMTMLFFICMYVHICDMTLYIYLCQCFKKNRRKTDSAPPPNFILFFSWYWAAHFFAASIIDWKNWLNHSPIWSQCKLYVFMDTNIVRQTFLMFWL